MNSSKSLNTIILIVGLVIVGISVVSSFISFSNDEIDIRNKYNQKLTERTAFYDKMFRIIENNTQIAVKNDQSFKEVVIAQVQGQKNGDQLMWSWVQQSNPAATYGEVSKLYEQLSRTIEGERNGFFENEKILSDIVMQHNNLIKKFPGSLYNIFLGRDELDYKPIQASRTSEVMRTGIDNNVRLDL